jgi:NAD(P)H-dependent flavin oxidoreductase YrpB (nitropropane dioxygenase family)
MEYVTISFCPTTTRTILTLFQVWTAGQVIGLIHDIPTCDELCKRIEKEAAETLSKAASLYQPSSKL